MAEIRPLKAWRYNPELAKNIDELTSPLFDVVSETQRQNLYQNPFNSIHISVPQGKEPAQQASETLRVWKDKGIVIQDKMPSIYVYYQYFFLPGIEKEFCRKGFICNIRAYDWEEMVILRHENTIPSSVNDRISILEHTLMNVSPTHGLYSDQEFELEKYMDESILNPILETEDYQGVRDVLGVIHDRLVIQKFVDKLAEKQIILADGHHRYEGSLAFKNKCISQNPAHTGDEAYNYHFMYLTNGESDDIKILPTHRLIKTNDSFVEAKFLDNLNQYFYIQPIERNSFRITQSIKGSKWMYGILLPQYSFLIQLKPEALPQLSWNFPQQVKELDLTILHYFIIEKVLGIPGKDQRKSDRIFFERSFEECENKISLGEAQVSVITNPLTMKEIKEVCFSGYTLPQKSTYFYPKVICGFLFSSIKEDEVTNLSPCL